MSEPTAKGLAQAATRVSLVAHPGLPTQRALATCDGRRADRRAFHLNAARSKYPNAEFGWLDHSTGKITKEKS
jgi:hypothetical protein